MVGTFFRMLIKPGLIGLILLSGRFAYGTEYTAKYTTVTHVPFAMFEEGADHSDFALPFGDRNLICAFSVDQSFIKEVKSRATELDVSGDFFEQAIIMTVSDSRQTYLVINALSKVKILGEGVYHFDSVADRNLYSFISGVAFANSCF